MKKFFRKVVKSFKRLADAKLLAFGKHVTVSMAAAVDIFPNPVPSLADINTMLGNFADLIQTAASRDKVQVELKKQARFNLLQMLSQLADYVNATTTDPALLIRSGFNLNKIPTPVELEAPTRLVLLDGPNAGELILKFRKARGASSYLHQYTIDALLTEDGWVSIPSTTTAYTFKCLTRGVTYYVRTVAVGSNQQLIKSIVVNRVSQ
ncbi:MAG TPA: hypothetical protein VGW31_04710 [Hanamia sp.]|nr:hypothetical protein [Hanamia sp.]